MSSPNGGSDSFGEVLVRAKEGWQASGSHPLRPEVIAALTDDLLLALGELQEREQFTADRRDARKQVRALIEGAAGRHLHSDGSAEGAS